MRKRVLSAVLAVSMVLGLAGCGSNTAEKAKEPVQASEETKESEESEEGSGESTKASEESSEEQEEITEASEIHWARANSGNILVTIAKQQGYFDEYGLTVIEDPVDSSTAALTALQTEQVDVTSNQGTNGPLGFIGKGSDFTIVGGYMLKGMYIVGRKDTEYKDVTSLKGSKFAYNGIHPVTGIALLEANIDPATDAGKK